MYASWRTVLTLYYIQTNADNVRKINHIGRYSDYVDYGVGNQRIVIWFQARKRYIISKRDLAVGSFDTGVIISQ